MDKNNFVKTLNPITKLTFVATVILSSILVTEYQFSLTSFVLLIAISIYSTTFKEFIKAMASSIFILVIIIFIMQALFYPGKEIIWQWKIFSIKMEGIRYAANLSSKILVIGGAIILFFKTTSVTDFVISLQQRGLSPVAAYIILATLQIIPQMNKKSAIIMEAQKSRGMETEGNLLVRAKAFVSSLGPLVLSSIAGTEERAITLEAKAFSAPTKKTHLNVVPDSKVDRILRLLFIFVLILFIARRIYLWIK